MRFRSLVPAILGLALLLPAATAVATPGAAAPAGQPRPSGTFLIVIDSCEVLGNATSVPGNQLTVKHRSASGKLKRKAVVSVAPSAAWALPCPGPRVRTGDRFQLFTIGGATPFRTFVVPKLRLRPDRVHDVVRGNAPGTPDALQLTTHACAPDLEACARILDVSPTPHGATGALSVAAPGLTGGMFARIFWTRAGDQVELRQFVARLEVRPGSAIVSGFGGSVGQSITVTLKRGQATGKVTRTTGPDAAFRGTLRRAGAPMKARAGDRVTGSFASDALMKVPVTSLTFDGDSIDGRCFRNAKVSVQRFDALGHLGATDQVVSDGDGIWTVDASIPAGLTIRALCADPRGDIVIDELLAD